MRLLSLCFGYLLSTLLFLGLKSVPPSSRIPLAEKRERTTPMSKSGKSSQKQIQGKEKKRAKGNLQKIPLHLYLALKSKNVIEDPKGSNRGHPIDEWRDAFGIARPVPWCAIFGSVKSKEGKVRSPRVWSCAARDFAVKGRSWKLSDVIYGRYVPKPGDYRVKTRRGGNHIDIFIEWDEEEKQGKIIGGNVADRVLLRKISLQRMISDGTTHITEVDGCYNYCAEDMTEEGISAPAEDEGGLSES